MGMKIKFNAAQLEASIHNIANRASKNASRDLRRAAIKVRDLARQYAPLKSGVLADSIDYATAKDSNRRNVYVVFIDLDRASGKDKEVGDYAWIMEEQLHPHGRQKGRIHYDLDSGSIAKNLSSGKGKVGGRFLSRAVKDGTKAIFENAFTEVQRTLGSSRIMPVNYTRDTGE